MLGFTERRAIVVATLFALAGCSGGSSTSGTFVPGSGAQQQSSFKSVPAGLPPSFVHSGVPFAPAVLSRVTNWAPSLQGYSTKNPLVFEGDQEEAAVNVYASNALQTNPAPIATIAVSPGCPYGMAMDKTGTLYVATNCGGNTVEKYPKGKTSASGSISDGISNPLGLAFDSKGTLYVSNYPGAITEYPSGKTSPSKTITQNLKDPFGLALDSKGDLFVADFGAEQVFEIKHGSSTVTPLNLQDLQEPLGVAVDQKNGDLWVTDGEGVKVNVYKAGSTTPSHTITAGYSFPYAISIYQTTDSVVVSNINGSPNAVYAYKPNKYSSYATLTNGVELPTGLLWAKP